MEVGVRVFWHVVVEDDVDTFDVYASSEEVGGYEDSALEVLYQSTTTTKSWKASKAGSKLKLTNYRMKLI
jgi:hypothetical protein